MTPPDFIEKADRHRSGNTSLQSWTRALSMTANIGRNESLTLPVLIEDLAEKFGSQPALLSDRDCFTYRDLAEQANRYARWALAQGLRPGDVVCLLMSNCPEYVAIWLGLTRIGAIVALINTNLAGNSLVHSLSVAAPGLAIVEAEYADVLAAILPRLAPGLKCWVHGRTNHGLPRIDDEIRHLPSGRIDGSKLPPPTLSDRALYIYTSGTTGLPKAAGVSHFRLMQWSHWFSGLMDIRGSDRMYDCLPMYHSVGGVVAIGATLVNGGSVVLRRRFSASQFWDDIARWNCTLFQYIGELCHYLINTPQRPREDRHGIRLCCGNGMGAEVWTEFQRRFRVPQVLEFYAATEANFSLYNCDGKPGAIGRIPPFLAHRFAVAIVKIDLDNGEPLRNREGFCARCAADETGEAIGRIFDDGTHPASRFEGYSDEAASRRKILRNVFAAGDAWFRTGDLMRRDAHGYFYFVDRIGDTFRWKGENVSTTEVAEAISTCSGVLEAVVYGVPVAAAEGRAGMAAIVAAADFDLAVLRRELVDKLPEYARPLFLRVCGKLDLTATLKPQKQDLLHEGYDPAGVADAIYLNDRRAAAFMRVDEALYCRLKKGELRL